MSVEDILLEIAPEFAGEDLSGVIAIAELRIRPGFCGDKRPLLVAYLAAHIKAMAVRSSNKDGAISSLSEGGLSISYNTANIDVDNNYTSTSYGREYEILERSCSINPRTGRTNDG